MKWLNAFLIASVVLVSHNSFGLDRSYYSLKYTQKTPFMDEGGVFPKNSLTFNSSTYREVVYSSPQDKAFSVQLSALLNEQNEVDQLKAFFDWGGIVIAASQGSIEGQFRQTQEARLPGQQDPDALFQTLLPSEQSFKGDVEFYGIGWVKSDASIVGIGYQKTVSPILLSVDTYQPYTFGYNNRTGQYENYNPEGSYPWKAIDAEGTIEFVGLWVRLDPLRHAFEIAQRTRKASSQFFFEADIMTGFASYTPGKQVEADYALATETLATSLGRPGEGTTLNVADAFSYITNKLTYGTGYQMIFPSQYLDVGLSLGIEGTLQVNLFESDYASGSGESAELFSEASSISYGYFIRLAAVY